ncbi:MAG TPA: BON domain-containing protein, partial [Pyrinomonadaceae bacterium]|nr:BON domain-containing protein [Pyrinomonadaceae bacterium]
KSIPGVARVVNNIEILPVGGFDEGIRRSLYRQLSNTGGLSRYLWTVNPSVRLIVDRGNISLEGYVANKGDYNTMNVVAHGVPGAFSVTNNLKIDSGRAN